MSSFTPSLRGAATALAAALALAATASSIPAFAAPADDGAIAVHVAAEDGRPVARARVVLVGATTIRAVTDANGASTIERVAPGTYDLEVDANGFARLSGRTVSIVAGAMTRCDVALSRATSSLVTLGHVVTQAGEALSTASAPSTILDARSAAAAGTPSVADLLAQGAYSVTSMRISGGSPTLPVVAAIRGPDPTETLVDVDGIPVNSGASGAFDLSLLDPSMLSDVQVVYGIAPSSLVGPDTIDGAIDIHTIDPTSTPEGLVRLSIGSFDSFGETVEATGSSGDLGYALSLRRTTTAGEVDQEVPIASDDQAPVGSAIDAGTGLAKLRYSFDRNLGFAEATIRDQSAFRDLSAGLTTFDPTTGLYDASSGSTDLAHDAGYGFDASAPLGVLPDGRAASSLTIRHTSTVADQTVNGAATGTTPFLNDDRDHQSEDSLEWDRPLESGSVSIKVDVRSETLDTQEPSGGGTDESIVRHPLGIGGGGSPGGALLQLSGLSQQQRYAAISYEDDPTSHVHYSSSLYLSDFSSFGSSTDPRFGVVWTPTATTAVRGSVGTTFQAPQLPESYVPPTLPPPDANGFYDIGNPHLSADRATDYDIGSSHVFGSSGGLVASADLYDTDLRDPSQRFFPATDCLATPPPPVDECASFPINVGDAVYRGIELRADARVGSTTVLHASYTVNSTYASDVAPAFQDGTIVVGEQSQGIPLHVAKLSATGALAAHLSYEADAEYQDSYDAYFRPAFTVVDGALTWTRNRTALEISGTNLTNVDDDRFTVLDGGLSYGGAFGPIPANAYALQGRAVTFSVTRDL